MGVSSRQRCHSTALLAPGRQVLVGNTSGIKRQKPLLPDKRFGSSAVGLCRTLSRSEGKSTSRWKTTTAFCPGCACALQDPNSRFPSSTKTKDMRLHNLQAQGDAAGCRCHHHIQRDGLLKGSLDGIMALGVWRAAAELFEQPGPLAARKRKLNCNLAGQLSL